MSVANVAITDTFDQWRIKTNQLIIANEQTDIITRSSANTTNVSFNAANAASIAANAAFIRANAASITANVSFNVANVAFDRANSANLLAFNTGIGANAFASATIAGANTVVGAGANTVSIAAFGTANAAFIRANAASITANVSFNAANASFIRANAASITANVSFDAANASFARANAASITASVSFNAANASFARANASAQLSGATFTGQVIASPGAGQGSVSLTPGTALNPGYIQFNSPDGIRRGYIGWNNGNNLNIESENGWNYNFNQAPLVGNNPVFHAGNLPGRISSTGAEVTNWNDATEPGFYLSNRGLNESVANTPDGAGGTKYWHGYVTRYNTSWIQQVLTNLDGTATTGGDTWRRFRSNGTWLGWHRVNLALWESDARYAALTGATFTGHPTAPEFRSYNGPTNTQQVMRRMGWSNGVTRWAEVIEGNASLAFYAYDTGGNITGATTITPQGQISSSLGTYWHSGNFNPANYAALSGATFTSGISSPNIMSTGPGASIGTTRRDNSAGASVFYSDGGITRLYAAGVAGNAGDLLQLYDNGSQHLLNASGTLRQIWHAGNFNPASYAPLSGATFTGSITATGINVSGQGSVWHPGNFNPASYAPLSGAVMSGVSLIGYSTLQSPSGGIAVGSSPANGIEITGQGGGNGAFIRLHRPGAYGALLGLDSDNQLKIGGWSFGDTAHVIWHGGNFNPASYAPLSGANFTGNLQIRNTGPVITLRDTNDDTASLHVNDGQFYILGGPPDSAAGAWIQTGGRWPLQIDISNGFTTIGGGLDATFINIQGQPVAAASVNWDVVGSTVWGYPINGASAGIGGGIFGSNLSVGGQIPTGTWRHVGNYNNLATAGPANQPSLWRRIA